MVRDGTVSPEARKGRHSQDRWAPKPPAQTREKGGRRRHPVSPSASFYARTVVLSPQGGGSLGRRRKRYVAALDGARGNNGSAVYCDIAATGDGGQVSGAGDGGIAALDAGGDAAGGESHVAAAAHCCVSEVVAALRVVSVGGRSVSKVISTPWGFGMRAVQVLVPLKQEGDARCVARPAGPGMFTGAVLKGYGGLQLTLQAYRELLRIRWGGSRLGQVPRHRDFSPVRRPLPGLF